MSKVRVIRGRYRRLFFQPPGLRVFPRVMPMGNMKALQGAQGAGPPYEWQADRGASFILLGTRPTVGWNMIELGVTHDQRSAAARITLDVGRGFEERHSFYLVVRGGRISKRIFFIPYGTRRIRLEPLVEQSGCFRIHHFQIVWLTPRFAHDRMIRRLGYADARFQHPDRRAVVDLLRQEEIDEGISWKKLLYTYYEATFVHCSPETSYAYWQEHIEILREPSQKKVRRLQQQFVDPVRIAVVLVAHNGAVQHLAASLGAVTEQRYPHWQLFAGEALLEEAEVLAQARGMAARDDRIGLLPGSTEEALSACIAASPDYVMLLRVGDRLARNALYHIAHQCQMTPGGALIYGDDDIIDAAGERVLPNFKPRWNDDYLLAANYIGHAAAFSCEQLQRYLAQREDPGDVDVHALMLASGSQCERERVHHLPFVIYHNDAANCRHPMAANATSQRAVESFVQRLDANARVRPVDDIGLKVSWPAPEPAPLVSLLVPTRDRVEILRPCVDTLLAITDYPNYEILILDNQSSCAETRRYLDEIQQDARVRVLAWNEPFNYSSINNYGVEQAHGSVIGLVNNDIEPINPGWLTEMVGHVCRAEIGCVGAKLYYPNDTVQHGGVILGLGGVAGHAHRFFPRAHGGFQNRLSLVQNLSAVTAACLLVRRAVFEEVGGLNEADLPVAYNDVDLCLKVREAGYRNLWTPFAELYHHESISRGVDDNPTKRARAKREVDYIRYRWREALQQDPAYNPNLTVAYEDFSLR
ncbi:glycosyltransferase family 2 protein [Kushneria aurantia]|uniref:Glycosyltransferase n=1 Tax=Kushneria aurantia TaxID=504092 RepID=A0ABV6FZ39_9GAMM|nr:glycosyltransferase family 2 protein [Kushneria aurantia]